jgi:hypothetical protein
MTVIRGGKIKPYAWTDVDGKRHKSWRWSVNVDGKQHRRQGYVTKAEAEAGLDAYKVELVAPKPKLSMHARAGVRQVLRDEGAQEVAGRGPAPG